MKITCQACQSKYTIADDKIQGKVAKIRCRKCGATVLVDASVAGGAPSDASARTAGAAGPAAGSWLVNVGDGDQRSMGVAEIVEAYNSRSVTAETYVWKDGLSDWLPLGQVPEIVDALNKAASRSAPAAAPRAAGAARPGGAADYRAPDKAFVAGPAGVARREPGRAGTDDLFRAPKADEEVATSVPSHTAGKASADTAGKASDEASTGYSLDALMTAAAKPSATSSRTAEDSGLIDLNALAKAQAAKEAQPAAAPATAAAPFLFPAALGQVAPPPAPVFDIPEPPPPSSTPKLVAIGITVALVVVGVALFASYKEEPPPPIPAVTAPPPVPTPESTPTATEAPPPPAESASAKTPKKGGARQGTKKQPQAADTTAAPVVPTTKKAGPCGCGPGDLQCQIRCSATGK